MKYIFCIIAIILQPVISFLALRKKNKNERALNLPLIYFTAVYLIVQIYVFFKYCLKFKGEYEKYSYIIQAVIFVIFLIIEFLIVLGNQYVKQVDNKEKEQIQIFKELINGIQIKSHMVNDAERQKRLNSIIEKMRYEDPVSNTNTAEEEMKIKEIIDIIDTVDDDSEFEKKCSEIERLLEIRKIKNMSSKEKAI